MLLKYVTENFSIVQWPGFLTSRLAYLGPIDQLKTILQATGDANLMDADYSLPLHCAIMRNNTTAFDALIGHGADPAVTNSNWKNTPAILVAAKHGRVDMVKRLTKAGASVDAYDNRGRCALWLAAVTGQHLVLQALLEAGADKRALEVPREGSARPPIVSLASVPFLKCLKLALEFGADLNCKLLNGEHPSSALSIAARWGLPDSCRVLLEAGAHHDADDDPLLIHAVNSGKREIVEMLLEKGAKVDAKLEYGDFHATPLIIAAQRDYQDLAKLLIERGAGVDTDVWEGSTALHYTIGGDNPEMVKFLVDSGANTEQTHSGEWSALQKCYAKADCMKVLLEAGADLNWAEPDGTALYLAVYYNALDVAKLILSYRPDLEVKCPSEKSWDSGYTALHVAASYGFTEMLRLLIEAGADLKSTTPMGGTPLILAVANNSEGCTRALLEYDTDIDAKDVLGYTALHCLPSPARLSIAKLLVNRGANLELRNNAGKSVLDLAITSKDVPLVEFLLDKKVDINAAASSSGAALHVGAAAGDLGMVKLLVRKGADVNLTHPWMYGTALQKASMSRTGTAEGRDAVARFLVDEADADVNAHGGVHGSALDAALLYGTVEAAKFLIERGADVGWKDAWGRGPVHFAALQTPGHFQLLLDSVSDIDDDSLGIATKTNLGHTPLHFAVASGSTDLVELVLSRTRGKTSINEPDEDGWTPLLWACRPCDKWGTPAQVQHAIVKLLLDRGADPLVRG
ncbi:ankyrin repeat-containing domain protein [Diaporthe sp. PMI_573]|nr:ankyrin repeat-containing domain protein [Diaporthaceae sp. PMI_573]